MALVKARFETAFGSADQLHRPQSFLDLRFGFVADVAEHGLDRARFCDTGKCNRFVQNPNWVNPIAKVFERLEVLPNRFCHFHVTALDGTKHVHALSRCDANTTAGESRDTEVTQVNDRGLFSDAADNSLRRKDIQDFAEIIVFGGIVANDCVFDP